MSEPKESEPTVEWVQEREPHPVYIPEHLRDIVKTVER